MISVKKRSMIVTDFDGTLFTSDEMVSNADIEALHKLGKQGHIRVIATGRSLYSVLKSIPVDLPFDYLICSTGAAIYDWKSKALIGKFNLGREEVKTVCELLDTLKLDYILQEAVPDNHKCFYVQYSVRNSDLEKRNLLYEKFVKKLESEKELPAESCQFIVIFQGEDGISCYEYIKKKLNTLKVIRTTSPLDHKTLWIEIYPKQVSKAHGINILREITGIDTDHLMVLGNDYNDLDMLLLTKYSYIVSNAPDDLKKEFITVHSNNENGFAEAVNNYLLQH